MASLHPADLAAAADTAKEDARQALRVVSQDDYHSMLFVIAERGLLAVLEGEIKADRLDLYKHGSYSYDKELRELRRRASTMLHGAAHGGMEPHIEAWSRTWRPGKDAQGACHQGREVHARVATGRLYCRECR